MSLDIFHSCFLECFIWTRAVRFSWQAQISYVSNWNSCRPPIWVRVMRCSYQKRVQNLASFALYLFKQKNNLCHNKTNSIESFEFQINRVWKGRPPLITFYWVTFPDIYLKFLSNNSFWDLVSHIPHLVLDNSLCSTIKISGHLNLIDALIIRSRPIRPETIWNWNSFFKKCQVSSIFISYRRDNKTK